MLLFGQDSSNVATKFFKKWGQIDIILGLSTKEYQLSSRHISRYQKKPQYHVLCPKFFCPPSWRGVKFQLWVTALTAKATISWQEIMQFSFHWRNLRFYLQKLAKRQNLFLLLTIWNKLSNIRHALLIVTTMQQSFLISALLLSLLSAHIPSLVLSPGCSFS